MKKRKCFGMKMAQKKGQSRDIKTSKTMSNLAKSSKIKSGPNVAFLVVDEWYLSLLVRIFIGTRKLKKPIGILTDSHHDKKN